MSKTIKFDLSRFPLLTPKAFALPDNKEDDKKKENFLVGAGSPPGIYGKGKKIEYKYLEPAFTTQFQQLMVDYRKLGQELKHTFEQLISDYQKSYLEFTITADLKNIDKIIAWATGNNTMYSKIAENQRLTAARLFKTQMEDILFYMRTALSQARTTGDSKSLNQVKQRIIGTLIKLDEAFTHCSEQITDSIMSEQMQWTPVTGIADHLLRRRTNLVDLVARENNPTEDVHRGTAAHSVAHQQGYGVIAPQHTDPYGNTVLEWIRNEASQALLTKFITSYSYEAICTDVCQELFIQHNAALTHYIKLDNLTQDQQDTLRDKMKALLSAGICQEGELFETISQTGASPIIRVNRNFLARLPEYCVRYTMLTLEQQGYVKDIGQLPWRRSGEEPISSLDKRIQSYCPTPSLSLEQWCAEQWRLWQSDETILAEKCKAGDFFTLLNLLEKKPKDKKGQKDSITYVFNPFSGLNESDLFDIVLTNSRADVKSRDPKPILQDWQRTLLLRRLIQHPAVICEHLTGSQLNRANYVTMHCSFEIFTLYWDRIIALYSTKGQKAFLTFLNSTNRYQKRIITYALETGDFAKIQKLVAIPGVNLHRCVSSVKKDAEQKEKVIALIECLNAIESKDFVKAKDSFSAYVEAKLSPVEAKQDQETTYQQILKLLKDRYGNSQYSHHEKYQAFLQYLIDNEKDLHYLLILKKENPAIDLSQPRLLRLKTGEEIKDTPLRVAIKDDDDIMIARLRDEAKANPNVAVDGENAWLLIANKTSDFTSEREEELLQLLLDESSSEIKLPQFLLQLAAPQRTDTAFCYILQKIQEEKAYEYHLTLGDDLVYGKNLIGTGPAEGERKQEQIKLGRKVAAADPEATRLTIAQHLTKTLNTAQDEKSSILQQVVSTCQSKKVMSLLLATANLDMSQIILKKPIEGNPDPDHPDSILVHNLIGLVQTLCDDKPDYTTAQRYFTELYAAHKNPEHYQKLLTIIINQCSSKNHHFEFFKQLVQIEQNVACLQLLKQSVPIDLITTLHYAARFDCSAQQFKNIWRETVDNLPDLSQADSQLKLANLVACLLEAPPRYAQQQLEKLLTVLAEFPIMAYLRKYDLPLSEKLSSSLGPLHHLIRLLNILDQGHLDLAITYYLIDQQPSDIMTMAGPLAGTIKQQFGTVFFNKFLQQLTAQKRTPTGLMKIQKLIIAGDCQQAVTLLLEFMASTGLSDTHALLPQLRLLLSLRFIGHGDPPWLFDKPLEAFLQQLLKHVSYDASLQWQIILYLLPLDRHAAAQLFCDSFLVVDDVLLPEKLMMEKLVALQQTMVQSLSSTPSFQEFFHHVMGQLSLRQDFRGYDQLLTHFFADVDINQPIECRHEEKHEEKTVRVTTTMPLLPWALSTHHDGLAKTILDRAEQGDSLAVDAVDSKELTPLMHMVAIPDTTRREEWLQRWLAGEDKEDKEGKKTDVLLPVSVSIAPDKKQEIKSDSARPKLRRIVSLELRDAEGNNALMRALNSDDEKTALLIFDYALQVFRDHPAQLTQWANQTNRAGQNALTLAMVNQSCSTFVLHSLKQVPQLDLTIPFTLLTARPVPGFTVTNILSFLKAIHEEPGVFDEKESNLDQLVKEFAFYMGSAVPGSIVHREQVVSLIHILVQQYQGDDNLQKLLCKLLDQHNYSEAIVSALLTAGSSLLVESILIKVIEYGTLPLVRKILDYLSVQPWNDVCIETFYKVLRNRELIPLCGKDGMTVQLHVPWVPVNIQDAVLNLFFTGGIHLDAEQQLRSSVKDFAIDNACFFTIFLKISSYDTKNDLLTVVDQKELSTPKRIFLTLLESSLLESSFNNPVDETSLYQQFDHLLILIGNEGNALSLMLDVLQKKLSKQWVKTFLNGYLTYQQQSRRNHPKEALIEKTCKLQNKVRSSYRTVDEKGIVQKVAFTSQNLLEDGCNFVTFLSNRHLVSCPSLPLPGASGLSMKKYWVLLLRNPNFDNCDGLFLKNFALFLNEKDFKAVLPIFNVNNFAQTISYVLSYSDWFTSLYEGNKKNLEILITYFYKLKDGKLPQGDSLSHLFIRYGCWEMAQQWVTKPPDTVHVRNTADGTLLDLAIQTDKGDAKQRHAFFKLLAAKNQIRLSQKKHFEGRTALMNAVGLHCDAICFQELLAVCSAEVINYAYGETALLMAVDTNQPEKVRALLETKRETKEKKGSVPVIGMEDRLRALQRAQQQGNETIVDIFWSEDKEHQLKWKLIKSYKKEPIQTDPVTLKFFGKAYYLLYKDNLIDLTKIPNKSDLCAAMMKNYSDYPELLGDEKTCGERLVLLQQGHLVNQPLFGGISLLDYALQNNSPAWVFDKIFKLSSLTVSAKQFKSIYTHIALREKWIKTAFSLFVKEKSAAQIASLFAQLYLDLAPTDHTFLKSFMIDVIKNTLPSTVIEQLCQHLLQKLSKQFVVRDDVTSFVFLFKGMKANAHSIIDPATGDTTMTFAVQHGWLNLITLSKGSLNAYATRNGSKRSPLELALLRPDKMIIDALLTEEKTVRLLALWPVPHGMDSALILAIQLGDLTICQKIVEQARQECKAENLTAFLNYKNAFGKSALYLAVELQREDIVVWLLSLSGIDKEAYCITTYRSAALCSYQQTQLQQAQPQQAQLQQVQPQQPQIQSTQSITIDAKIEIKEEEEKEKKTELQPVSPAASRILEIFTEKKLINSKTLAVDYQLAEITQHLHQGQQDRAIQELFILLEQQGVGALQDGLQQLFPTQRGEPYHALTLQLNLQILRVAATKPECLSLMRDVLAGEHKGSGSGGVGATHSDMSQALYDHLKATPILFSQATLDTLQTHELLKFLWPAAALAYARACRNRPQHVASQQSLIQHLFTQILNFPAAEVTQPNGILSAIAKELTLAQQKFFSLQTQSIAVSTLSESTRKSRNQLLQQGINSGDIDTVKWILTHSTLILDSKTQEKTQEKIYLVDVNIHVADKKTGTFEPLIFKVLERAQQEDVNEEKESKKPFYTILKMLISHRTWQDISKDSKGHTLLICTMMADPRLFIKVLEKTKISTKMMQVAKQTAMDFALPNPEPDVKAGAEQKARWQKQETNKYKNAESLATDLRKEFDLCLQHMQALREDSTAAIYDDRGDKLNLATLCLQARHLAIELLKFDAICVPHLPKQTLGYGSFFSSVSEQTLLQDIQRYQEALGSGQPIVEKELKELKTRTAKSPRLFIQQLIMVWDDIVVPSTAAPSPPAATVDNESQQKITVSVGSLNWLSPSKPF